MAWCPKCGAVVISERLFSHNKICNGVKPVCNTPFDRLPQCACDLGVGPPPSKHKITCDKYEVRRFNPHEITDNHNDGDIYVLASDYDALREVLSSLPTVDAPK